MTLRPELIDELLKDYRNPEDLMRSEEIVINGFDDKILSLYARGMTTRDIQAQLLDLYDTEVSHTLISNVTEASFYLKRFI